MTPITGEQLSSVLRQLAVDLVAERRRVARLERENRELRGQIEALRRVLSLKRASYPAEQSVA